jgi:hypothetical protein
MGRLNEMQAKILTFPSDRARCPGSARNDRDADVIALRVRVEFDPVVFGLALWLAMWGIV